MKYKNSFFGGGLLNPQFNFSLRPYYLSDQVASARLNIADKSITYRHGPQQVTQFAWPGNNPQPLANLVITHLGGQSNTLTAQGPWALFKLIDQGKITPNEAGVTVAFKIAGEQVSYLLQSQGVSNPFQVNFFSRVRIPDKI